MPEVKSTPSHLLTYVMFVIVVVVWSVVGFLLWIPLLVRSTFHFAATITYATVTQRNPAHLRHYIESASSFYSLGFRAAWGILEPTAAPAYQESEHSFGRFLSEILWAFLFWIVTLCAIDRSLLISLHALSEYMVNSFTDATLRSKFIWAAVILSFAFIMGLLAGKGSVESEGIHQKKEANNNSKLTDISPTEPAKDKNG